MNGAVSAVLRNRFSIRTLPYATDIQHIGTEDKRQPRQRRRRRFPGNQTCAGRENRQPGRHQFRRIQAQATTTIKDGNSEIYAALTGDQCAITDIRITNV